MQVIACNSFLNHPFMITINQGLLLKHGLKLQFFKHMPYVRKYKLPLTKVNTFLISFYDF